MARRTYDSVDEHPWRSSVVTLPPGVPLHTVGTLLVSPGAPEGNVYTNSRSSFLAGVRTWRVVRGSAVPSSVETGIVVRPLISIAVVEPEQVYATGGGVGVVRVHWTEHSLILSWRPHVASVSRSVLGLAENLRVIDAALIVDDVELSANSRGTVSPGAMFAAPIVESFTPVPMISEPLEIVWGPAGTVEVNVADIWPTRIVAAAASVASVPAALAG